MVLYDNITVGQRVEVLLLNGRIYTGQVRYKGYLGTQKGDWVGISLDLPVGHHNGMYKGRRYFQCKGGHGVFVRANRIRFIPIRRSLFNSYHKVESSVPDVDTHFRSQTPYLAEPEDGRLSSLSPPYYTDIEPCADPGPEDIFGVPIRDHRLRHLVSNHIPAASMLQRPRSQTLTYSSEPMYQHMCAGPQFITSPSVPQAHMPFFALKRQVSEGWDRAHYTRHMSVPTGRDSIKFSQWNDISL